MTWRFQRRKKLAPGVTLNMSKRSLGLSVGPRGAKANVGPRGLGLTLTLLGTGLSYIKRRNR